MRGYEGRGQSMGRKTDFLKLPDNLLEEVKGEYTYTRTHAHTHTHHTL